MRVYETFIAPTPDRIAAALNLVHLSRDFLSLGGRAYNGLGWRFLFASTQAGRLQSGTAGCQTG